MHLSCQNENFLIFSILAYEISVTTELIELKFSGIREGVNKLAVLKFQSNLISLRKNLKIWNSKKITSQMYSLALYGLYKIVFIKKTLILVGKWVGFR